MAVPSYTNDLITLDDFEGTIPTLGEFSTYADGRTPAESEDYPIQGTWHIDDVLNSVGHASIAVDNGANITWTSGWAFFIWIVWTAPGAINTQALGGLMCAVGSGLTTFETWYVGGSDSGSYPYGGWQNFAVNPEIAYSEQVGGGPGTSYRWVGGGVDCITKVAKGSPLGVDVIRYGRGTFKVSGGQTANYANFSGMAAANDSSTARWGLFQEIEGGYKWKGRMQLGATATLCEFIDSDKNIVVDDTEFVATDFNRLEVINASTNITWTNISISALGTKSLGDFVMIDNAVLTDTGGQFTDMGTFAYKPNSTLNGRTYRRCSQVTQGNADIDNCTFAESTASAALVSDNPNNVDLCTFTQSTTGHAIRLATACAGNSYTITGCKFNNYNATDGSTGNEGIYNNSGGAVTINIVDGVVPSVRNGSGATTTIQAAVPITIDVFNSQNASIHNAVVALYPDVATTVIVNATTNKDGRVSSSYNYTSDQTIRVRIRKSSPGDARYIPVATTGVITSDGYTLRQTLIVDSNASL